MPRGPSRPHRCIFSLSSRGRPGRMGPDRRRDVAAPRPIPPTERAPWLRRGAGRGGMRTLHDLIERYRADPEDPDIRTLLGAALGRSGPVRGQDGTVYFRDASGAVRRFAPGAIRAACEVPLPWAE